MAIISEKLLRRRPQELGKIKIGGKGREKESAGGKMFRLPVKFDHFVVTTRHRGADENFVKDAAIHSHAQVGENPIELAGILMYDTPEENFHSELVRYDGRKKVWTCNGEQAINLKTGNTGECQKEKDGSCKCKPYARLHLQLWASPHVFGYHVFRTTGWESTNNIQSTLREIYERFGTCYHAPVKLVIYPAEDRYMDGNVEKTSTSYKVGLVLAMSMDQAVKDMIAAKNTMTLARKELKMLSGSVEEEQKIRDREEEADIAEEFFPEVALQASIATQERTDDLKAALGVTPPAPVVETPKPPKPATKGAMDKLRALRANAPVLSEQDEDAITVELEAKNAVGVEMWTTELKRREEVVAAGKDEKPPREEPSLDL